MNSLIDAKNEHFVADFRKDAMDRLRGFLPHDRTLLTWLLDRWAVGPTTVAFRDARAGAHLNIDIQLSDALSVLSVILRSSRFVYSSDGKLLTYDFPSLSKRIGEQK